MWQWIRHLDRLLRGQATQLDQLKDGKLDIPIFGLAVVIDILGLLYGACMGAFALTGTGSGHLMQVPATMIKVPALFLLTLLVTLPSLYVFNALVGSRLTFGSVVRLLVGSLAVTLAVLASIGPIVAFFSLSTISYHFMVLLNTTVFAISGAGAGVSLADPAPDDDRKRAGDLCACGSGHDFRRGCGDAGPDRSDTGPRARASRQDRLSDLGDRVRIGGLADGMDSQAVHRCAGTTVRMVQAQVGRFLSRGDQFGVASGEVTIFLAACGFAEGRPLDPRSRKRRKPAHDVRAQRHHRNSRPVDPRQARIHRPSPSRLHYHLRWNLWRSDGNVRGIRGRARVATALFGNQGPPS